MDKRAMVLLVKEVVTASARLDSADDFDWREWVRRITLALDKAA